MKTLSVSRSFLTKGRSFTAMAMLLLSFVLILPGTLAQSPQPTAEKQRKAVEKTQPHYPEIAKALRLSGAVRLSVKVAPNGKILSAEVLGGHPVLAEAALDAVRQWRYEPAAQQTQENVIIDFQP